MQNNSTATGIFRLEFDNLFLFEKDSITSNNWKTGVNVVALAVADPHSKILDMCPLWVQILLISCSFWENLAKSYAGAPLGVDTHTLVKSWIRNCLVNRF